MPSRSGGQDGVMFAVIRRDSRLSAEWVSGLVYHRDCERHQHSDHDGRWPNVSGFGDCEVQTCTVLSGWLERARWAGCAEGSRINAAIAKEVGLYWATSEAGDRRRELSVTARSQVWSASRSVWAGWIGLLLTFQETSEKTRRRVLEQGRR